MAYCAGLLYWVSDRLDASAEPSGLSRVVPPLAVFWAGLACAIGLAALIGLLIRAVVLLHRLRRVEYARLAATPACPHTTCGAAAPSAPTGRCTG
ncbi:hypothetical protein V2I01_07830 [Micromonospora sp. BRA006-A]|nr:hypothetical protein [Micromonospora sp. BRA006-A]